MKQTLEALIRQQDWIYEDAGTRWQDGLVLGNGNLGVVSYAPYGLEWVLNKGDVFDGRLNRGPLTPHRQVMERFFREKHTTVGFLDEADAPRKPTPSPVSKSAALLRLRFGDDTSWGAPRPHRVRQRLCLWEGELYSELDLHLSHPRWRGFVPRDTNLFCWRLENAGAAMRGHLVELARPVDDELPPPRWQGEKGLVTFEQAMTHGARYAVAVLVVPTSGPQPDDLFQRCVAPVYQVRKSTVGEARLFSRQGQVPQNGNADVFVAIYTGYETRHPRAAAVAAVRAAARRGFATLEREHRAWWKRYWHKGWADFGKHRDIQRYWTFGAYATGSLLGKAPVPGLYGLWYGPTDGPQAGIAAAWYTHDQNVQMPVMPAFPLNHAELVEPFADTYLNVLPALRRHTRQAYQRPGVFLPLTMNQLGDELPTGSYRYSLMGGAYSALMLVWAWRYTRDRDLLRRKLYPLLRELLRFHVDCFTLGADGRYHLDYEIPPEIYTMSRDCTATLALLKPCLEVAVEASRLFRCDTKERRHWEDILARYPAYPQRPDGGWWAGADVPHDHYTHAAYLLYPFFPAEAGDEATAARTLDHSREHDIEMSYADTPGRWHYKRSWSWFFPTVTRLRLGRRAEGWAALHEGLRLFSKPNGLFSHNSIIEADPRATEANLRHIPHGQLRQADGSYSPLTEFRCHDSGPSGTLNPNARRWVTPASEGSAAFLFAATETLLQSHGDLIRLFPGVPADFTGGFERLLAQGAIEVSATMQRGVVTRCRLVSKSHATARVLNPWRTTPPLPGGGRVETINPSGRALVLPLRRGQAIVLRGPSYR